MGAVVLEGRSLYKNVSIEILRFYTCDDGNSQDDLRFF